MYACNTYDQECRRVNALTKRMAQVGELKAVLQASNEDATLPRTSLSKRRGLTVLVPQDTQDKDEGSDDHDSLVPDEYRLSRTHAFEVCCLHVSLDSESQHPFVCWIDEFG
jgi:hypothetical protein